MNGKVINPNPGWNNNPAATGRDLGNIQQVEIRKLEDMLKQAEQEGLAAQMVAIVRQSIIEGISSDQFRDFIKKTTYDDNQHWPIAIMSPARVEQLGLPKNARVVQLSSQTVDNKGGSHRKHWINDFDSGDWEHVQQLIDSGVFRIEGDDIVLLGEVGGKTWKLVIKGASGGKIYIKTYHKEKLKRLRKMQVARNKMQGLEGRNTSLAERVWLSDDLAIYDSSPATETIDNHRKNCK